jgi:formamidopyrimidine-DNA glycosylase
MPELPEVETIAKGLRQTIVGKKVDKIQAIFPRIVRQNFNVFKKAITQKKIKRVRRRGKYLLVDLSGDKTILIHLGMTGNLLFQVRRPLSAVRSKYQTAKSNHNCKHDHLIFCFLESNAQLCYNDQRKFGRIKVFDTDKENQVSELKKLGPDAIDVTPAEFIELFKKRKGRIKSALLNQHIVAGLGNIYADESLFEARINPAQKIAQLSKSKLVQLHKSINKILRKAIKAGGSSIDNYLNVDGNMGRFQLQHKVYGREGERCKRCKNEIKRIKINQRSSYFCPRCQPLYKGNNA